MELNRLMSITLLRRHGSQEVSRLWIPTLGGAFSSAKHDSGTVSDDGITHESLGFLSHSGLYFHNWLVANSPGVSPFDGRSAGFSLPGQWFERSADTSFRISSTQLWTKCFQSFSMPLIQKRVICESVKHLRSPRLNLSD